jgi:ribosomal protein S10
MPNSITTTLERLTSKQSRHTVQKSLLRKEEIMIRKTFKRNIVLSVTNAEIRDSIRTVETVWTVDLQGDKVIDLEIVSCDGDLDERQYDELKEVCMAMRNIITSPIALAESKSAITVELIDEGTSSWAADIEPEHWNEYQASCGLPPEEGK